MFAGLPFQRWDVIAWFALLAILAALEFYGIANNKEATLTAIICKYLPWGVRLMVLTWLTYHFLWQHR